MPKPPLVALLACIIPLGAAMDAQAQGQIPPQGREPGAAPYDPFAQAGQGAPAPSAEPSTPGFRITVPMCRKAEQANDPLARIAECAALLKAAEDQARACRQAFEAGDDQAAMSPACRQAAGFR
jgi:hypothetical protein